MTNAIDNLAQKVQENLGCITDFADCIVQQSKDNLAQKVQESLENITDSVDNIVQQSTDNRENTRSAILALSTATIALQSRQIENDFEQSNDAIKRDRWLEIYIQWAIEIVNNCQKQIISDSEALSLSTREKELRLSRLIELAAATINNQRLTIKHLFN